MMQMEEQPMESQYQQETEQQVSQQHFAFQQQSWCTLADHDSITTIMNRLIIDTDYYSNAKPLINPFGDGQASDRIVEKIKGLYENSSV